MEKPLKYTPKQTHVANAKNVWRDKNEKENLIKEREIARDEKNWQRADEIRAQLSDMKVVVEDGASGSKWRIDR